MNRTILVVGDLSGIGKSLANDLQSKGITVVGRDREGNYYIHDPEDLENLVFIAKDDEVFENLDTIVDCGCDNKQLWIKDDPTGDEYIKLMQNNTQKFFQIYNDFIDVLRKNEGIFMTIASVTGHKPMSCSSAYCSSKSSMIMLSKVAAREEDRLMGNNVGNKYCSFVTVSPIVVPETPLLQNLIDEYMIKRGVSDRKQAEKDFTYGMHNGKVLTVDGIVKFINHLINDNRDFCKALSGSDLHIGEQWN